MVRKVTPSQYNALLRQQQQKQREAIRKYNQEVTRVNRENKRLIDEYNREVRRYNQNRRNAVNKYNQAVRNYNLSVSRERQRRLSALRSVSTNKYFEVTQSSIHLNSIFDNVEFNKNISEEIISAAERESINSSKLAFALNSESSEANEEEHDTGIIDYLSDLSDDLCNRWRGALYALNPNNNDAARHFCTSVREIFTEILDRWAENEDVIAADVNCERTPNGTPSRRAKIKFLLRNKSSLSSDIINFIDSDIEDILNLFPIFNKATHGAAGSIPFSTLKMLRQRVEGGIMFLATIAAD